MTLTVELALHEKKEITPESIKEVAIFCDEDGLELIIRCLESLHGKRDHEHLMTPSWAGDELTEEKQGGRDYMLVNHLRIVKI